MTTIELHVREETDWEPNILMFACNWCSYAGLDLAGTSRMRYPVNVTIIKTMCSGRIEPTMVMKAFKEGVDGVIISMCHAGDCHYQDGNYKTMGRFHLLQEMLKSFGIEQERVIMVGISASEARKAVEVITEMVEKIQELGPFVMEDDI